ncbi:MAG: CHAT domain-containing tetratricopeptide repeat protein [Bryobacteraceae bacterium]|nr:CHAT domain-containing tetratricopeptide repeat protein [Bryobacteraceae bacterium]
MGRESIRSTSATAVLLLSLFLGGDSGPSILQKPSPELNPGLQKILTQATKAYSGGDIPTALRLYRQGQQGTPERAAYYRAVFLTGAGNCEGLLWRNAEALHSFHEAIRLAEQFHYDDILMKASVGRISVFRRMNNPEAARQAVDRAETVVLRVNNPTALTQLASVARDFDFPKAVRLYRAAILTAGMGSDDGALALVWNQLGLAYVQQGDLENAEVALTEAFRLRWVIGRRQLQTTYTYLGILRRLQGRNDESLRLLLEARRRSGEPGGVPLHSIDRELARTSAAAGDRAAAVAYYESTVRYAVESRIQTLPAESFRTSIEEGLHGIFAEYVAFAMGEYERTKDERLAARMFGLASASRSSLFQASSSVPANLPPEYLLKIAEFRRALATSLSATDNAAEKQLASLRMELANLELELGLREEKNSPQIFESEGSSKTLQGVQRKLRETEVLLSFMVTPSSSFVWGVTRNSFEVHRLPGAALLAEHVTQYRVSMETGLPEAEEQGRVVADDLLAALSGRVRSKRDWILSLDAPLYDLPFASLPDPSGVEGARLGGMHSLRVIPAAPSMSDAPARSVLSKHFAGQADPVYNRADSRFESSKIQGSSETTEPQLPRLPGSARELRKCAAAWTVDQSPALLTGVETGREALMRQITRSPAVLHLGMHVVSHPLAPDQVMIALGRWADGEPDYLSPLEITKWHYPLGLVTLSGCSSGTGQARQGLGLFGLSRAWLIAGAQSVVASYWPIRDDDGQLLADMYSELSRQGGRTGALEVARALQFAQNQSGRRRGWQSSPSYWAAFFVVGKE